MGRGRDLNFALGGAAVRFPENGTDLLARPRHRPRAVNALVKTAAWSSTRPQRAERQRHNLIVTTPTPSSAETARAANACESSRSCPTPRRVARDLPPHRDFAAYARPFVSAPAAADAALGPTVAPTCASPRTDLYRARSPGAPATSRLSQKGASALGYGPEGHVARSSPARPVPVRGPTLCSQALEQNPYMFGDFFFGNGGIALADTLPTSDPLLGRGTSCRSSGGRLLELRHVAHAASRTNARRLPQGTDLTGPKVARMAIARTGTARPRREGDGLGAAAEQPPSCGLPPE